MLVTCQRGGNTARTRNSVSLLEVPRPRALDSALDQEVLISVVELIKKNISHGNCILIFHFFFWPRLLESGMSYSFANTPLKAAQAPLAAARASQELLVFIAIFSYYLLV